MARVKKIAGEACLSGAPSIEPPMTLEDQEDQLISLAVDLAMSRLRDGTASNQLISEIIKMGTVKEKLTREKLKRENEMLKAKTDAIEAARSSSEKYLAAIRAFGIYSGRPGLETEFDDYDEVEDY